MKSRFLIIAGLMTAFGIAAALRPPQKLIHRDENWLEDATPTSMGNYQAIPGLQGDKQTYRMPAMTYNQLQAYGIISRVFTNHDKTFDVCVIASNTRLSFHDPTQCFPSQDWKIIDRNVVDISTKTRGIVPIALMHVQHGSTPPTVAAYTYKGPREMATSQTDLYTQWALMSFVTGEPQEGAFYRFMAMDSDTTAEQLKAFISDYMDLVKKTSNGIL